jgi:hypothetical protein
MKKLLVMIMLLAGFSGLASAQTKEHKQHKTPEQKAQHLTQVLQKKLTLSADQSVKVNAILLKSATRMDSLKATRAASTERKANRQSRKAILVQTDESLKAVLNADQQKAYAELKAKMKDRMKHKRDAKTSSEG